MERENRQVELTPEERAMRKKRAQRKRKMRLAIVVIGFILVIGTVVGGITSLFVFRVKSFSVESESGSYEQQEIIDASGISMNKSLLFIDLDEAEEAIERNLPLLKNVEITKKLPTGLVIRFEESGTAYAVEVSSGTYAITNDEFKVLSISGVVPEGAAVIKGQSPVKKEVGETISFVVQNEEDKKAAPVEDKVLNILTAISSTVSKKEFEGITAINVSSLFDIYIIYQDRILIELGDSQNIESKTDFFIRAIEEENMIDNSKTGVMDFTISETAYFCPADIRDIPELAEHLGVDKQSEEDGGNKENAEEAPEEESGEEQDTTADEE